MILPGDHVEHRVGGGRGILINEHRTFVSGDGWTGAVAWGVDVVKPVEEPPTDKLWADYCAYRLVSERRDQCR